MTNKDEIIKTLEFYADCSNFIIMDGKWFEYQDSNFDLTSYMPIGTKAEILANKLKEEQC